MTPYLIGPITAEWIAAYAAASGDDNPVHLGTAAPDVPPIVHGALLAALLERAIFALLQPREIAELSVRFLSPVVAGATLEFKLGEARQVSLEAGGVGQQVRVTARQPGKRICLIADCVIVADS